MKVVEKFVSIDGEGPMAGELATFVRFEGCNLRCSWCDTSYSWDGESESLTASQIYDYIISTGINHITLTGGEPLLHEDIEVLLAKLSDNYNLIVNIETNGSVLIAPFKQKFASNIRYVIDYKLPDSGMTNKMDIANLKAVTANDTYKFVIASSQDLEKAYELICEYDLNYRCNVHLSPVQEQINPQVIVDYMKQQAIQNIRLQLQLHKFIWPKECRGV
ncbi:MAG: radical SAM protein [Epulopiscium sp. Nele67-Bin002]|nr:MAG: putative 7-carboxy-7-deazaguanine synthase QueE [Epulopiscium sp. Nuni2H_MBin001]OON91917.1 MAG: radical SAM protein [Epulopiscium sp. Nele67-Bin002]OON92251.1 MAG: putative 7-carboxy-7-deazaguanine synthase QueE [Epulopiscium sp. Nele67-Bin001]